MREYELTLILVPKLEDKDLEKLQTNIKKWLEENKAKVQKSEDWGVKRLAYPIAKNQEARYLFYTFKAEVAGFSELEKKIGLEEKILRYLLIRKDQ